MPTLRDWLQQAQDLEPIERELLASDVLQLSRAQILVDSNRSISQQQLNQLQDFTARLRNGEPYAYLTGRQEFWSLDFQVSPAVLIPRPETELLVELVVARAPSHARILDLGTGSGAIAISIAHQRPDLNVTACDISVDALQVAQLNNRTHNTDVQFIQSDWFSQLSGQWDIIVSNPPYIAQDDPHLPQLQAEPSLALIAGDGLDAIRTIIAKANNFLSREGQLLLEHGFDQANDVQHLFAQHGYLNCTSHKDLAGILRVTAATRDDS